MAEMNSDWVVERLKQFFGKKGFVNVGKDSQGNVILKRYWDDLLSLALAYPDEKSLYVDFNHVGYFDEGLADTLLTKPDLWLEAATEAIDGMDFPTSNEMPNVQVRIVNLPAMFEVKISKLREKHIDRFISFRGTISREPKVDSAYHVAAFECLRCGHVTLVPQAKYSDKLMEPFAGCESDGCGKNGPFTTVEEGAVKYNHQYLIVQEPLENLHGQQPQFITVSCSDELTGIVHAGERVVITGILKGITRSDREGKTKYLDFIFAANSIVRSGTSYENIEISPEEAELFRQMARDGAIKDLVLGSIAPSIFGMEDIKLGIALQLFGGMPVDLPDGTRKRGDIHIMLVGDPGVAKSQLLRFVAKFAPKAVEFSGRSSSDAGLTGAVVWDDKSKRWWVMPGALTFADNGGICCADEVDKMKQGQLGSIHEALEQQMVHINKVVKADLPTRTAFLGAANPINGRYDKYSPIASQIGQGAAFLSRMDLIFIIMDQPDKEKDEQLARHILKSLRGDKSTTEPAMDLELFRKLIAYARTNVFPELTDESQELIIKFFVETRAAAGGRGDTIPITTRTLEAAFRLATAHAKMRLSNVIEAQDAKAAVELFIKNLRDVGIDPQTGELDAYVLECGTSGSQREQLKYVIEVAGKLSDRNLKDSGANLEEVIQNCKVQGIQNPEFLIKKLKERGEILSPKKGFIKVVMSTIPD